MSWHVSVQEGSGIRKIMAKAWLLQASSPHERVIRLEVGQPNFATPQHVIDATIESLQQVENQGYIQSTGLPELRDAIAQMYTSRHRVPTSPEQVRTPLTLLLLHLERSHKIKRPKYKVHSPCLRCVRLSPDPMMCDLRWLQVLATHGAMFGMATALMATVGAGEEVLVPDPGSPITCPRAQPIAPNLIMVGCVRC